MTEIQKADPQARKRLMVALVSITIAGCVLVLFAVSLQDELRAWLTEDPSQTYSRLVDLSVVLSLALLAPMLWFTTYLWRMGSRIRQAGRLPLPGTALIRDTVIVRGAPARRRGRILQLLAATLLLATVGLLAALWSLLALFRPPAS